MIVRWSSRTLQGRAPAAGSGRWWEGRWVGGPVFSTTLGLRKFLQGVGAGQGGAGKGEGAGGAIIWRPGDKGAWWGEKTPQLRWLGSRLESCHHGNVHGAWGCGGPASLALGPVPHVPTSPALAPACWHLLGWQGLGILCPWDLIQASGLPEHLWTDQALRSPPSAPGCWWLWESTGCVCPSVWSTWSTTPSQGTPAHLRHLLPPSGQSPNACRRPPNKKRGGSGSTSRSPQSQ